MSQEVRLLEPLALWNHFADLNAVPRPSKKEERVIQFMLDFGHALGLAPRRGGGKAQVIVGGIIAAEQPGLPA